MKGREWDEWVIMKAGNPGWSYVQLAPEVRDMIGLTPVLKNAPSKPSRTIAFMNRGPGLARVISMAASYELAGREMAQNRVVAQATPAPDFSFNLPQDLRTHLGLRTRPSKKVPTATRTDDCVAWMVTLADWDRYHDATKEGEEFHLRKGEEICVYLARALFPGPRRVDLEEGREVLQRVTVGSPVIPVPRGSR